MRLEDIEWSAFLLFFLFNTGEKKATFNLTLSEMDLNRVHILFQLNCAQCYTLYIPVYFCVKMC